MQFRFDLLLTELEHSRGNTLFQVLLLFLEQLCSDVLEGRPDFWGVVNLHANQVADSAQDAYEEEDPKYYDHWFGVVWNEDVGASF